jgi:GDP-4-dehydro-6-deoxy-D-mannose reductase
MRILVTGVTGFAGGHVAEALIAHGARGEGATPDDPLALFGTSRRATWPREWQHLTSHVELRVCDLCDCRQVEQLLRSTRPQQIYHLAGYAHVGRSFQERDAAWKGNLTATRSLYDAAEAWGGRPRILWVGSGLVYGDPETPGLTHDENAPLRPATPYACSKAAADLAGYQYFRAAGLDVVRARPFNHIGPRQSPQFAVGHFAQQIAAIEAGRQPPLLETGNLAPHRDLTDVRDMAQAYLLMMERGRSGEVYNAGTGEAHSMRAILDRLLFLARVPIEVRQRSGLVRIAETAIVRANATKLRRELGWTPSYRLDDTLADILNYWRTTATGGG